MPLYRVLSRPDLLTPAQRTEFSHDVLEVHCGATGAPPSFVHVLYQDAGPDALDGVEARIASTIRAGRNGDQKQQISSSLRARLARLADIPPESIATDVADIQASYTMEGGELLPEPGSEEEKNWGAGS